MSTVQTNAKPFLAYIGIALSIIGIVLTFVVYSPIIPWVLGAIAIGLGAVSYRNPATQKLGIAAMVLGFVSILVGLYAFSTFMAAAGS